MWQDSLGAILVVGVIWFVLKLAFGGNVSSNDSNRAGSHGAGGNSKVSAAVSAWKDGRNERERDLKRRKQELLEQARKRYIDKASTPSASSSSGPSKWS